MKKWAVAATAVLLLLSGCSDKEKANGPKEPVKEVVQEEVENEIPYHYPLTGVGSDTETDGRAVAVMVNNHPKARPQSGLHKADIVYEILAEGDVTRFLAVFQSEKPENIGPVRSARDYYIDLAKGLNALFIAHGSSEEAQKMLERDYVDNLNGMVYDGTLFKRASFRKAPHNSYITYKNVLKGAKEKKYSMDQTPPEFTFLTEDESKSLTGDEAKSVSISYSASGVFNSIYEYDASIGKYKRYSDGEQTIDYETKEPILLDNLFIIETTHQVIDEVAHKEIDLESGGSGYLLQKGKVMEVEWKNDNGVIVPVRNGEVVPFVQGKTWVNVVPTNPGLQSSVSFNVD
ncbi:DUF3048 domain-containing protein [Bacillus sp. EB106-08-02-XG196]|jgi:hypothetical protein|uniref:DUF3048 domain-containing protein n=1 Tax=Bacillus sp. EB106-08-02-XG196 TaxID=2737049 RepID=UPI0015C48770|nr:DUF3048 domain-containing protein [Bacillus sp. EB106-08-02-XG196]NWQ42269.1 DUF3048 domain-containing protein [Bacillus sp. EB106-08-02-XG196]